jgi:hypothetical protein
MTFRKLDLLASSDVRENGLILGSARNKERISITGPVTRRQKYMELGINGV